IRDGGLMNDHFFEDGTVRAVFEACRDGGIDYMEIGYKGDPNVLSTEKFGPWKFCSEENIKRIVGDDKGDLKISVMADVGRTDYKRDIPARSESPVDLVRIACYIHQIPAALDILKHAQDNGYETCFNLMAVSTVPDNELESGLELVGFSGADAVYVVDSFGSLYSEQVRHLVTKYQQFTQNGMDVGIHAHNNQQLAFANSIEAITLGCNYVDGSLAGLGRGAGNCPTELLSGFLHNPKYKMRPLLKCIQEAIEPLRATMQWGPDIPYMLMGLLNRHPREAIAFNAEKKPGSYVDFYDQILDNA
nr:aldolase catalytic domain-containing protein [Planctomycetota bacterium]